MRFSIKHNKQMYNGDEFYWVSSGIGGYENEIDRTISHLFLRLLKEVEASKNSGNNPASIYIFAYKGAPKLKWHLLSRFKAGGNPEIDMLFIPNKTGHVNRAAWEEHGPNEISIIQEFIDNRIPLESSGSIKTEMPSWSEISPSVDTIGNKIPDEWWVCAESGNDYHGFVLKDLTFLKASDNHFVDFMDYEIVTTGNKVKKAGNLNKSLLKKGDYQYSSELKGVEPIIATAKWVTPYIVKFIEPYR